MEHKKKRYYRVGEKVWFKNNKVTAIIKKLNINQDENIYKAEIEYFDKEESVKKEATVDLWQIDKLKSGTPKDKVFFSKVSSQAIIPSKRDEDAGYDFYACLDDDISEIVLEVGKPTLIPTGIATALPQHLYLNLKHERGSTGKLGMSVLSGVVDSGYRGEIFINLCSTYKKVIISKEVNEVIERNDVSDNGGVIYYPVSKAIAQGTFDIVPRVSLKEIPFDELQKIESKRGASKLGASGK